MGTMFANNPIIKLYQQVMNAKNPNMLMQQLAQNNPQLQQTLNYINQNGGNAERLFYDMAKQKGVDPNTILNQLK